MYFFRNISNFGQRSGRDPRGALKDREADGASPETVEHRAERDEQQGRCLQAAHGRRHAEREEHCERHEREEHVQPAAEKPRAGEPPKGAEEIEHQRERESQHQRGGDRQRLIGHGKAHPNSRAKKPSPRWGSSA